MASARRRNGAIGSAAHARAIGVPKSRRRACCAGEIKVEFRRGGPVYVLAVEDGGVGVPGGFERGLGTRLISLLANQLGSRCEVSRTRDGGARDGNEPSRRKRHRSSAEIKFEDACSESHNVRWRLLFRGCDQVSRGQTSALRRKF